MWIKKLNKETNYCLMIQGSQKNQGNQKSQGNQWNLKCGNANTS
jgi:hypothetical protein